MATPERCGVVAVIGNGLIGDGVAGGAWFFTAALAAYGLLALRRRPREATSR